MTASRSHVTASAIVAGLRALGVQRGDLLLVHCAMSRLGHVEGGVEGLTEALLEAVGPEGTLAMPGFSFQFDDQVAPVFDVRNTPTWASKVYNAFRQRPGVFRSHHVTHSVCATGARARELAAEHSETPCGGVSPFAKLAQWGGKLLLLGVTHNANTTFHAAEEQVRPFYLRFKWLEGASIIDGEGVQSPIRNCRYDSLRRYDFNRFDDTLARLGLQQQQAIGDAIARVLDVRGMCEAAAEAVRRDPETLLRQGEEHHAIQATVHGVSCW